MVGSRTERVKNRAYMLGRAIAIARANVPNSTMLPNDALLLNAIRRSFWIAGRCQGCDDRTPPPLLLADLEQGSFLATEEVFEEVGASWRHCRLGHSREDRGPFGSSQMYLQNCASRN